ncbi:Protein Ycf2 [Bienertia sinuspersici]
MIRSARTMIELFDCLSLFSRNVSKENWIWLDNVWLVNKDRFFSKVRKPLTSATG